MAWAMPALRKKERERCAEPGCERAADQRYRCWRCDEGYCWAHAIELVDEPPPRKVLCLACAAALGLL